MSFLIVNADDGGLAQSTDDAILKCAAAGILKSATVVANGPTTDRFVQAALAQGLDLGLHINLTQGRALAGPHESLTDRDGVFRPKGAVWRRAEAGELVASAVRKEVAAQWERLCALGVRPSHVDGHNHVHLFPACRGVLEELARGLWVRAPLGRRAGPADLPPVVRTWGEAMRGPWKTTDRFTGYAFCEEPTAEVFLSSLEDGARVTEFMVHPGAREGSPHCSSELRDREADILCSVFLDREIDRRGFRTVSFLEAPCG